MFRVNTGRAVYFLEFVHTVVDTGYDSVRDRVRRSSVTVCNVYHKGKGDTARKLVASYEVVHKHCDLAPTFAMGRKYALAGAIEQLALSKINRTLFWDAYFELFGKNKNAD